MTCKVKLARCQSALNFPWFTLLTVLRRWSRCWSYSLLLYGLFYEAICFMSYLVLFVLVFFSPFSTAITSLGEERELILVLFVRLFDFCLFGFVIFPSLLVSGVGGGLRFVIVALPGLLSYLFCRSKIAKIVPNRNPRLRPS